jgi:hypothetical protein
MNAACASSAKHSPRVLPTPFAYPSISSSTAKPGADGAEPTTAAFAEPQAYAHAGSGTGPRSARKRFRSAPPTPPRGSSGWRWRRPRSSVVKGSQARPWLRQPSMGDRMERPRTPALSVHIRISLVQRMAQLKEVPLPDKGPREAVSLYAWHPYMFNPQFPRWLGRTKVRTQPVWSESDGIVTPD